MNIIELIFYLKLENTNFLKLDKKKFVEIEKKLEVESKSNSKINDSNIFNFLQAIENNPKGIIELLRRKGFVKLFIGHGNVNEVIVNTFSENEKHLFNDHLYNDFLEIFKTKFSKNYYSDCVGLMSYNDLFSIDFLDDLANLIEEELIALFDSYQLNPLSFIKDDLNFFIFINEIRNARIDNVLNKLYNKFLSELEEEKKVGKLQLETLVVFANYKSTDEAFSELLQKNMTFAKLKLNNKRSRIRSIISNTYERRRSDYNKPFSIKGLFYFLIIFVILFRMLFYFVNSNDMVNADYYDETRPVNKNIKSQNKSVLPEKEYDNFINYLSQGHSRNIQNVRFVTIRTGGNPFNRSIESIESIESFYSKDKEVKEIKFVNNTNYNIVVIEYKLGDKFHDAFYLKRGAEFTKKSQKKSYSFYLRDRLANFSANVQNESVGIVYSELYKTDGRPETKFLNPANFSAWLLVKHFSLKDDVIISEDKLNVYVKSKGMKTFSKNEKYILDDLFVLVK